jgi:hypothetical protein
MEGVMAYKGLDKNDVAICIASIENASFKGSDVVQIAETLSKLKVLLDKEINKEIAKGG